MGGYTFYRVFVEGTNSVKTRYGDTRLMTDMDLLRKHEWVSLHDQLLPFSRATEKTTRDSNKYQ
jgi:hypothetical protein